MIAHTNTLAKKSVNEITSGAMPLKRTPPTKNKKARKACAMRAHSHQHPIRDDFLHYSAIKNCQTTGYGPNPTWRNQKNCRITSITNSERRPTTSYESAAML